MQKKDLVELIEKIQRSDGTEEDVDNDIDLLCNSVADPQAINYIFQEDLSAEGVADKIMKYKPVQL